MDEIGVQNDNTKSIVSMTKRLSNFVSNEFSTVEAKHMQNEIDELNKQLQQLMNRVKEII